MKVVASVRSLSSRWLAVCCTAGYLLLSTVLGAALLVRPEAPAMPDPGTSQPSYVPDRGPRPDRQPPAGFQAVAGPAKIQTVIPVGWRIARAGGPGAMRSSDPSDAGRFLGYGGAPAETTDIAKQRVRAETQLAERATDYSRVRLAQATYGGHPAVEWEYRHDDGSGLRHVCALYWLVDGIEYFVYASGPAEQWSRMRPVYDAMVANSRP